MKPTRILAAIALFACSALGASPALAQPAPPSRPIAVGTAVTLGRPLDADEVLSRLVGVECVAATKLIRNPDGSYNGSVTCGAVTLRAKRLALGNDIVGRPIKPTGAPVPMTDAKVTSGQVTILAIGSGDLFAGRSDELVGKVCSVTKTLTRDPNGYYAGELTCGKDRFYFAEVRLAAGSVLVSIGAVVPPSTGGPQIGQRWRIRDAGDTYTSINTTDCLQWPTPAMKVRGGSSGWGQYAPTAGDVGLVVGVSRHCDQAVDVVFLQVGPNIVPIGAQGVERAP